MLQEVCACVLQYDVRVSCNATKFPSPLCHQVAGTASRDPGGTGLLPERALLGAHTGASSFIMSPDGTPQFVPLYLARS